MSEASPDENNKRQRITYHHLMSDDGRRPRRPQPPDQAAANEDLTAWSRTWVDWLVNNESQSISPQRVLWAVINIVFDLELEYEHRLETAQFVEQWLGEEPESEEKSSSSSSSSSNRIPTLQRLAAQMVAAGMFPKVVAEINQIGALKSFHEYIPMLVASEIQMEGILEEQQQQQVTDELFVFTVVYFLFKDFRTLRSEPENRRQIDLPIPSDRGYGGEWECWWENYGQHYVEDQVPWKGRGLLAKIGLLPHAFLTNFYNFSLAEYHRYPYQAYCFYGLMKTLAEKYIYEHPLGIPMSINTIASLIGAHIEYNSSHVYEYQENILKKTLRPLFETVLTMQYGTCEFHRDKYSELLNLVKDQRNISVDRVRYFEGSALQTLPTEMKQNLLNCLASIDRYFDNYYGQTDIVTRMRLSGDHSTEYLLRCAVSCPEIKILDLQDCANLDEECLEAMLTHCREVKILFLKGTQIDSNCQALKTAKMNRKIKIDFSGELCRCCGRLPIK